MSQPPRTPLPSGIPLRRGKTTTTRDRPQSHIRTLSQQSLPSLSLSLSPASSPNVSPHVSQLKRAGSVKQASHVAPGSPSHVIQQQGSPNHVSQPHVSKPHGSPSHVFGHHHNNVPNPGSPLTGPGPGHLSSRVSSDVSVSLPVPVPASALPPTPISVHAVIRIKPSVAKSAITEFSSNSITVTCAPQKRTFLYDHVFGPQTTQSEIYAHFSKSTDQFVAGYNVTIMAYGQSGSGKSYTMGTESVDVGSRSSSRMSTRDLDGGFASDPVNPDPDHEGLVQRASADIFAKLEDKFDKTMSELTVSVSYVELYNEQFCDLLDPNPKPQPMVREDSAGNVAISGVAHVTVSSLPALLHLLRSGSELRQKGSTALNSESSRSHAIFTITLTQNGASSKFNFVDLAGSERLKNSEAKGERVKEGIAINGGLAALGKVISQLSSAAQTAATATKHISYRDSKLTRLLQDSLGGRAVTYLLSCITCDDAFVSETLSTLSYTQRARAIQLAPEISQNEEMEFDQMKREMEYWRGRTRELERERERTRDFSRDFSHESPSRLSSRDSPSRMSSSRDSPTGFVRESPTRTSRDRSRDSLRSSRMSPTRHHRHQRDWSHDSLRHADFDVMSPDSTFSPRGSTTDVSRTSPDSRENGSSRLNNTTEMHSAVEDMIKQYDLRILGLETALVEEQRGHAAERESHVIAQQRIGELESLLEQREDEIRELKASHRSESRATVMSEDSRDASTAGSSSRAPLESRISVLESHLDNSRVQHRRTLDELKRLSSHYEAMSRDLDRSRREVEKEKQLRYDVIAQMKRTSVSESRDEATGVGGGSIRSRTAASFTSSLFASLPRVADSADDERETGSSVKLSNGSSDSKKTSISSEVLPNDSSLPHFH
ncbi:Conserved hypothetical protein [Yarrowia lipolytica]|nr:hypothetical protein YALI1_D31402g [Yarrowia lipolytica]KAB8280496.1 P-loop containing nucleoside triphosphate hydrolase protein [Yarrowia lipolytica]KAE8169355.1 P-loop containing nucleoside triphosphate hydrolase protein [Yarrowia lipolytica]RMI99278.1 P-loop containing nucleoside triphosphate hydrolase protein [Yarrowia lipolytica]VBB88473.1 Conserved hypothetical protein [Yarrowia lipolytica]